MTVQLLIKHSAKIVVLISLFYFGGCASSTSESNSVYQQIGGKDKIAEVVDNFISEIEYSPEIFPYFENSNIVRFREKMIEHVCVLTNGPCDYTGDTMLQVHSGMSISEHDFNATVDLFINAMTKADIPHPLQNKVIATMVPTRKEIIYQ